MADIHSRYELLMAVMGPPNRRPSQPESTKRPEETLPVVITHSDSYENIQPLSHSLSVSDQVNSPPNDSMKDTLARLSHVSREPSDESSPLSSYTSPRSSESFESQSSTASRSFDKHVPYELSDSREESPLVEQFITFVSCKDTQRGTILNQFLFPHLNSLSVQGLPEVELGKTRHILYNWWAFLIRLLETTHVSVSERLIFIKSVISIAEHSCWKEIEHSELLNMEHQLILFDTLSFVVRLLTQKVLPHTLVNFCAKILVLSFF